MNAAPPSTAYRLRKFTRQNLLQMLAGGLVASTLVLALIGNGWGLFRTIRATNDARKKEKVAIDQAFRSEQVAALLKDAFAVAGPGVARGRDATILRQMMEQTARSISDSLKDRPDVEAELRTVIGTTLREIGPMNDGQRELEQAIKIYRSLDMGYEMALADVLEKIGHLFLACGQTMEAMPYFQESHELYVHHTGADSILVRIRLGYQGHTLSEADD